MKKYYPIDFDEKGNAILGTARTTPTSNSFIPTTWTPGGGSEEEGNGIKSITISPSITTTPTLESLFPIYYENLTEEEKQSGVMVQLSVAQGVIKSGDEYTVTITPTADWYAADMENFTFGDKGEPYSVTVTSEADDNLNCGSLGALETNQPGDEPPQYVMVIISVQS